MKALDFWFDPVSPYAWLAFQRLPEALAGLSYSVSYRPIVFAALLKHYAHKGPAEIEPKRAWTFRQVHWLGQRHGIAIETPERHPFNPIALSRLAWATAPEGTTPSRHACETILRHVWIGGADAESAARLAALRDQLAPRIDPASDEAKQRLRAATDGALARGVFGVPTLGIDDRLFWGFDGLDMAAACVRGDAWFSGPHWDREGAPRAGVKRA
ncbi:MAG: 2-hydroxychromene-2-carboxylate isomerase [Burkholderiales bacterium]|nr:2-hydroxychromene-2-carboxylate isomerase [Burkholderiales bacterium]